MVLQRVTGVLKLQGTHSGFSPFSLGKFHHWFEVLSFTEKNTFHQETFIPEIQAPGLFLKLANWLSLLFYHLL